MTEQSTQSLKGVGLAALGFTAFSTHDALIKTLGDYSVFQIIFFAVLFSFVPFTLFLMLDRHERSMRPNVPGLVAIRSVCILGSTVSGFYAFSVLPMAEVYSLIFSAPILITILAIPVLGEKVKLIRWIAIILGMSGVVVVLQPGDTNLSLGHLAGFMAAVFLSVTSVVTRKIGSREHSVTLVVYPLMTNLFVTGIMMIWVYKPMPGMVLATLCGIGMLSVIGQTLLVQAYRASEAQFVAPVQYVQMLWAIFFGAIFFDEVLKQTTVLGASIIILSGLLFVWREVVASVTKPILRTRNLRSISGPQALSSEAEEAEDLQAESELSEPIAK